jgi:site-specific recombinase XerD
MTPTVGSIIYGFFVDYLRQQKGLRPSSIRSYRDTLRLFLNYAATESKCGIGKLRFEDLNFDRVLAFLRDIEQRRGNTVATRNQRLAALHTFYDYLGRQVPEMLHVCSQVAGIPRKRTPPPETRFMTQVEVQALFDLLPDQGRLSLRDRALLLFLYNTGARVTEAISLRVGHLVLDSPPQVRLLGKGGKWRSCPLWERTAEALGQLLDKQKAVDVDAPVFVAANGQPMTRFGVYKRVRRLTANLGTEAAASPKRRITPHVIRHTTAVHLLEAGVEVNVIRGWLGHVSLTTTNRYAEITLRMKTEALELCEPPVSAATAPRRPGWHDDLALMDWLSSL